MWCARGGDADARLEEAPPQRQLGWRIEAGRVSGGTDARPERAPQREDRDCSAGWREYAGLRPAGDGPQDASWMPDESVPAMPACTAGAPVPAWLPPHSLVCRQLGVLGSARKCLKPHTGVRATQRMHMQLMQMAQAHTLPARGMHTTQECGGGNAPCFLVRLLSRGATSSQRCATSCQRCTREGLPHKRLPASRGVRCQRGQHLFERSRGDADAHTT